MRARSILGKIDGDASARRADAVRFRAKLMVLGRRVAPGQPDGERAGHDLVLLDAAVGRGGGFAAI